MKPFYIFQNLAKYLNFSIYPLLSSMGLFLVFSNNIYSQTPIAGKATTGTGLYKNNIYWLNWDLNNNALPLDPITNGVVRTFVAPSGVTYNITVKNITTTNNAGATVANTLISDRPDAYIGSNFPDGYGNIGGNNLAGNIIALDNGAAGNTVRFTLKVQAVYPNGTTGSPKAIVIGGTESLARNPAAVPPQLEYYQLSVPLSASPIRYMEKYIKGSLWPNVALELISSNTSHTVRVQNTINAESRGDAILMASDVDSVDATINGGGRQSFAIGFVEALDFSDAPSTYGQAIHLVNPIFTGGTFAAGNTTIVATTNNITDTQRGNFGQADLKIGKIIDIENEWVPSAAGTIPNADDINNPAGDDEDGYLGATSTSLIVEVKNATASPAYLNTWVDVNRNGTFEAGERIQTLITAGFNANRSVDVTSLNLTCGQYYYARFRLTSDMTFSSPIGYTIDGEVEDHWVKTCPPVAADDVVKDLLTGSSASLNILANDVLQDGSLATPLNTTVALTTTGLPAGSTLNANGSVTVPGEGTWTYDPITGLLNFIPVAGLTKDPTVIRYILTETATGFTDEAFVNINYVSASNSCIQGCNSNTGLSSNNNAATIEYDNIISSFHATLAKEESGIWKVWGEGSKADGSTAWLVPTEVTPANGYNYTGTLLKATTGSYSQAGIGAGGQRAILTSDGLYAWGPPGALIPSTIKATAAFGKVTTPAGTNSGYGLPAGVYPYDVKMLFGTYQDLVITTCGGEVYVLNNGNKAAGNGFTVAQPATWYKVNLNATTPLTNVIVSRGTGNTMFALKSDGTIWTWGNNTFIGDGTAIQTTNSFAKQMVSPVPAGVTIKMIGVSNTSDTSPSYYVLGSNGKLYGLGFDTYGQLGDFSTTTKLSWVTAKQPTATGTAGSDFDNIAWMSPDEHDTFTAGINIILKTGQVYAFGSNAGGMLGLVNVAAVNNPTIPTGLSTTAIYKLVETGGHTSVVVENCRSQFGYAGHRVDGSKGDGTATNIFENVYAFNTAAVQICGATNPPPPVLFPATVYNICPSTTIDVTPFITSFLPPNTNITWSQDPTGTPTIATPTMASPGVYYAIYQDISILTCKSISNKLTVSAINCCLAGAVSPMVK